MMSSWVTELIFFPPLPIVAVMSVVSAASLGNAGLSEVRGVHLKYSKFFSPANNAKESIITAKSISSRTGMLLAYTPAFVSAFSSLILLLINNGDSSSGSRLLLVTSALTIHFLKRILETLFIHKYSGNMALETAIPISLSYLMIATVTIYTQRLTQDAHLPDPSLDLKPLGVVLFLIGIAGNFYHHYLLSKLRTDSKEYKIPKGGMFSLVICPHYLFEIMVFYGISFMSQTLYSFAVAVGTTAYLTGRSYVTRKCVAKDTLEATQFIEDGSILISQGGMFALGFFSPGSSSSNRYLGIWYHKVTVQTVVWVANRNNPINGTSGVLSLDEHGSLVLYSSHDLRAPVWFANASSLSPDTYVAQLLDSGNLVLLQGTRRRIVWQSFDYPTDVALPGMKIGLNLKTGLDRSLTCWKSPNDPGIGDYSFKLDPRGSPQFFLQTRADHYWRSGPWPWGKFPDIYNYTFVNNEDEIYFSFSVNDKSLLLRTVIDDSGTMKRLSWHGEDGQWKEYWSAPKYRCDSYGRCGVYSICDPNNVNMFECTCLPNYEPRNPSMWRLRDGSGGCVRKRLPSSAFCAPGEGFLRVVDIKIPDTSSAVWISRSTSQVACEEACRRNCSCSAYSMKYIQGKQSGCLAWYGELQDTVVFKDSGDDLFVRVDARELADNMRKFSGDVELKIKLGIAVPSVASVLFAMAIFGYFRLRSWKREKAKNKWLKRLFDPAGSPDSSNDSLAAKVLGGCTIYPELPFYDLGSIFTATNSFSLANKIGEGGFGTVYKGQLSNGQEVAVKRLSRSSDQGIQELKNELLLIARLQHRNLVKLLGCCIEDDEQILVYEYVPNKSLDSFIFDETKRPLLNWRTRFNILVGIARGILYLHQDSRFRIIHRDLKSSNILLDEEMNPKISDFGLAKMFDSDQTQNKTTRVVGTYGYMSPEYAVFGKFSVKSDVFSFGIILLEVFSGNKINSFSQDLPPRTLIGHVWELWRENRVLELMDPSLKESCVPEEVLRCVHVGLLCVQENATDRPNMSAVVLMLNSETPLPRPNKPAFIFRVVDSMLGTVGGVDGPYSINDLTVTRDLAR